MPNNDTSGTRVQGTQQLTVQPTKQAEIRYRNISRSMMLRATETDRPCSFLVTIFGSHSDRNRAEMSRTYEERHPLMAIGRAVCQFKEEYFGYRIDGIIAKIKIVK
nr:MAG TPA: hypothetical protein [Caudoviricetes sp.]